MMASYFIGANDHDKKEYLMLDKSGKPMKEEIDAETLKAAEKSGKSNSGYEDQDFITLKPPK
jgi:hypothetical protein